MNTSTTPAVISEESASFWDRNTNLIVWGSIYIIFIAEVVGLAYYLLK